MSELHLIGNAHLDPAWLWRYTEGWQETRATFRSALERMKEFPDFVFTCAGAGAHKWVEETDPQLFEEIKARVREGRWVIVGGWWVQPDCNLPAGEAFARHGLYSQRYFQSRFGVRAKVGYNVDSFGHHGMLPQILTHSGMSAYVMMRPNKVENPAVPQGSFWWESQDGSRVLTHRIIGGYGARDNLANKVKDLAAALTSQQPLLMLFYGVGNHGGGPTIANLRELKQLQAEGQEPRLKFSSPNAFFEELQAQAPTLPVWRDELQHHASGCYATRADLKRANRLCENRLLTAEKWNSVAALLRLVPPATAELARAWENALFNQFHDIMGGCSIREVCDDALESYGETLAIAARVQNRALQSLAGGCDTRGEGTPIIVFNPHPFPLTAPVEVEIGFACDPKRFPRQLWDDRGAAAPFQLSRTSYVQKVNADAGRKRLCFVAELPPLGYRTYRLRPDEQNTAKSGCASALKVETLELATANNYLYSMDGRRTLAIENDALRLEINGRTGRLDRLFDKTHNHEVFQAPAAAAVVLDDRTDTWAHGVFKFRDEAGRFSDARVKVLEEGPVRVVARAESFFGESRLLQDFILYAGLRHIEVRVTVDWREKLRILKFAFPLNVAQPKASYEIPYGVQARPANGEEEPLQNWFDVTGQTPAGREYGVALLNDGKYAADVLDSEMRLTALRSAVHAHHTDHELEAGEEYAYMDLGRHEFRYVVAPHAGGWRQAHIIQAAQALNAPPVAQVEHLHAGQLPPSGSFLTVDAANVLVTVLKQSEDNRAWILRAYETTGETTAAAICLPQLKRALNLQFRPYEIKTVRIPLAEGEAIRETDFLED